jgi:hypothetical protein
VSLYAKAVSAEPTPANLVRLLAADKMGLARMNVPEREGDVSIVEFQYLVGTPDGIDRFSERHELGLFTVEQYLGAFRAAGLEADHDPEGPMGRGLYVAADKMGC